MAVIVLSGMPATGKSTICKSLTARFGYPEGAQESLQYDQARLYAECISRALEVGRWI